MTARINHVHAVTPRGGHHVKTAAYFEARVAREHVTAGCRKRIDLHDEIDDDLTRMNQPGCLL
jgi:hypothetical protein